MIYQLLKYYTDRLDNFVKEQFSQSEGVTVIAQIGSEDKDIILNKLVVSLLNVERETAQGIASNPVGYPSNNYKYRYPPTNVNINVVIAAVYDNKRYQDALSVLSSTILFIQSQPTFYLNGNKYTIEIVTTNFQELNNIWGCIGGLYYPSVICQIRGLVFDSQEIAQTSKGAEDLDLR